MDLFGTPDFAEDVDSASVSQFSEPAAEDLGHPRAMLSCIGHGAVEKSLLERHGSGKMPHALIFSGPEGIGKATMAYRLARFLFKNPPDDLDQDTLFGGAQETAPERQSMDVSPEDPVFRRVASGGHPDLLSIERVYDEAKNKRQAGLPVSQIRKVAPFLHMTASEGGWRVVIIDDADTMNRNAQNALLKILEEPPQNAILILVTHKLGALVPTIRSRAHLIRFNPLDTETMEHLLGRQGQSLSMRDMDTLTYISEGSFGKVLRYIEGGGLETFSRTQEMFARYPEWNWPDIHVLAEELARAGREQSYESFREFVLWVFQTLAMCKAREEEPQAQLLNEEMFNSILQKASLERLLEICENLEEHFEAVGRANLDKRQSVIGAFSILNS